MLKETDKPANPEIATSDLFKPTSLGPLELTNRIVMAPLTRSRALEGNVPGPLNAEYYAQRSSAGLIISEATQISQQGQGYAFTPGIYTDQQIEGWKLVTTAVHAQGGRIFAQLWHVGRISHPDLQPNNELPVAPSAIKPEGLAFTPTGFKPFVTPRALNIEEIPGIIQQYVHAAKCAKQAGFDGIEIHAANGYLLDQFIRDKTNKRTDAYGGSVENRTRIVLEVIDAVTKVWPSQLVGIRLAPVSPHIDISDSNPVATFFYLVEKLNRFNLSYIHCVEGAIQESRESLMNFNFHELRKLFNGKYIANNCYNVGLAMQARRENTADLICFGRPFLANPDLVRRLYIGAPLQTAPKETWYGGGAAGYTDWSTFN